MLVYYPILYEKQTTATLVGYRHNHTGHYEFGIIFCEKKPINIFIKKLDTINIQCKNKNQIKIIYLKKFNKKSLLLEFLRSNDRQDFIECLLDANMIEMKKPTSIVCCLIPCIGYYQRNYKFVRKRIITKMI